MLLLGSQRKILKQFLTEKLCKPYEIIPLPRGVCLSIAVVEQECRRAGQMSNFFFVIHQDVQDYLSVTVNPTNGLASQHLPEELKRNGVSGDGVTVSDNHHFFSGYKGNYMQINSFIQLSQRVRYVHSLWRWHRPKKTSSFGEWVGLFLNIHIWCTQYPQKLFLKMD